jgi:hypothetical protein
MEKKCKGVTDSAIVHKQRLLSQTSTHRYWKVCKTTVFLKCNKATCYPLCQLESVDDIRDFQRLSVCS